MRCEDYPCCGHELGCCPDYDDNGRQLNMRCTCGAKLPLNNRSSICDGCLRDPDEPTENQYEPEEDFDDDEEDFGPDDREFDDPLSYGEP